MRAYLNLELTGCGGDIKVVSCALLTTSGDSFLEVGGGCLMRLVTHLLTFKKKHMYIYVDDLFYAAPLLKETIKDNSRFNSKAVIFNLNVYYLELICDSKHICFYNMGKLWPTFEQDITSCTDLTHSSFQNDIYLNQKNSTKAILTLKKADEILNNLFKKYKLNQIKNNIYSAPSFAYKCFFKNFNNWKIVGKLDECVDSFVRDSYFGGRCEVFGNPTMGENIEYFDFSAMYSQCMLEKFPIGLGVFVLSVAEVSSPGFYDITFESKNMELPILPHKNYQDDKLMFTNGAMRGVYWYEEILFFLKRGGEILKIHSSYVFKEEGCVFENFIENFINLRQSSEIYKRLAKLYINSFYGRLGISKSDLKSVILTNQADFENLLKNNLIINFTQVGGAWVVEFDKQFVESYKRYGAPSNAVNSNVIYAAIITSKARIKLYDAFEKILKSGGRLLYCDTDCIFYTGGKLMMGAGVTSKKKIIDAIFISPKTYLLKYIDGDIEWVGLRCDHTDFHTVGGVFYSDNFSNSNFSADDEKKSFKRIGVDENFILKRKFIKNKTSTTPYTNLGGVYI